MCVCLYSGQWIDLVTSVNQGPKATAVDFELSSVCLCVYMCVCITTAFHAV